MKKYNNSLVIGKFYPPHLGHKHLIDTADDLSSHVTVLVMGTHYDSMKVADRVKIMKKIHPRVDFVEVYDHIYDDYLSEIVWDAHQAVIDNATPEGMKFDAVFTSELYGGELAVRLGAHHHCVDINRKTVPISATAVRKNLYLQWRYLHPEVRNHFKFNVTILGAESTGTTTLAQDLKNLYRRRGGAFRHTEVVDEYGREYTDMKMEATGERHPTWRVSDFWDIAQMQDKLQREAWERTDSPILINDTDSVATRVFMPCYGIEDPAHNPIGKGALPADIYFVTSHKGMPLVDDGTRLGDLELRNKSTQFFIDAIQEIYKGKAPYVLLSGSRKDRLEVAVNVIDNLMNMEAEFRKPV